MLEFPENPWITGSVQGKAGAPWGGRCQDLIGMGCKSPSCPTHPMIRWLHAQINSLFLPSREFSVSPSPSFPSPSQASLPLLPSAFALLIPGFQPLAELDPTPSHSWVALPCNSRTRIPSLFPPQLHEIPFRECGSSWIRPPGPCISSSRSGIPGNKVQSPNPAFFPPKLGTGPGLGTASPTLWQPRIARNPWEKPGKGDQRDSSRVPQAQGGEFRPKTRIQGHSWDLYSQQGGGIPELGVGIPSSSCSGMSLGIMRGFRSSTGIFFFP